MTVTRFEVVDCCGDPIEVISVPFTGDLMADTEAAQVLFAENFEVHRCGQCGDSSLRLREEPLDNAELYPPEEISEDDD